MKKIALLLAIPALLFSYSAVAQNVGINETGAPANASAGLDVDFDNKGFLLPRVALTSTTNQTPIGAPANSLMVYNTATAGDVTPGYYYWNGTIWKRFAETGDAWRIDGNAGTNAGTNFLGTTDNVGLAFRTNNTERMQVYPNGNVGINTVAVPGARFLSIAAANQIANYGFTSGTGFGVLGYNFNGAGVGVYGLVSNNDAYAGFFDNDSNNGMGVVSFGGSTGNGLGILAFGSDGIAGLADETTGTGVFGIGNGGGIVNILPDGSGMAATGYHGIYSNSNVNGGTGLVATGNNLGVFTLHPSGSGIAAIGRVVGVYGVANNTTGDRAGGIFQMNSSPSGGLSDDVRVAARVGSTNYKIVGWGAVSTIVQDTNEEDVIMFAPEAPEVLFQDYGIGELENGKAFINLDPIITKNINVSEDKPLKVFIQLEGDCNGVYVTNKTKDGFEVIELNGGQSNVPFSWSIVATRANQIIGNEESDFSVRFPKTPDYEPATQGVSDKKSLQKREINNDIKKKIENF